MKLVSIVAIVNVIVYIFAFLYHESFEKFTLIVLFISFIGSLIVLELDPKTTLGPFNTLMLRAISGFTFGVMLSIALSFELGSAISIISVTTLLSITTEYWLKYVQIP